MTIVLVEHIPSISGYPEPPEWTLFQEIANYIFTALFVLEFMVKISGYGVRQYFGEQFNRFDFVIVALNLVEIVIAKVLRVESLSGLSAFRSFRLIKVRCVRGSALLIAPSAAALCCVHLNPRNKRCFVWRDRGWCSVT